MEENNFIIENGILRKYLGQEQIIKIPETVSIIGEGAFKGAYNIEKLIISDSVKVIRKEAFKECFIYEIEMGNGVESIEESAFENIHIGSDIELSKNLKYIGKNAFSLILCYDSAVGIRVPASVIKIEKGAFSGSEFKEIILENGIKNIESNALSGTCIENINIPGSVNDINEILFSDCDELKKVKLDDGITRIKDWAFDDCELLENIEFPSTLCEIGRESFRNCDNLKKVRIATDESFNILEYAFENSKIEEIEIIAKKHLYIREDSFAGIETLKYVKIFAAGYSSVTIEKDAFQECSNLESVEIIANSELIIGKSAFEDCSSLRKLSVVSQHFPVRIAEHAFLNCTSLSDVKLSNNIYLYENAFEKCSELEKINWIGNFNSIKFIKEWDMSDLSEKEVVEIIKNPEQVELCNGLKAEYEKKVDVFDDDDEDEDDEYDYEPETSKNDEILKKLEEINKSIKENNQSSNQYNNVDIDELMERLWEIL